MNVRFLVGAAMAAAVMLAPSKSHAEEYLLYGLGIANSAKYSSAETKILSVGWRDKFPLGLTQQVEGGHFFDGVTSEGRLSSWWASYSLGVEVENGPILLRLMIGPEYLASPDAYLGGHFQFNNDAFVGTRDKTGRSIGIAYKHMSSAGIETPNIGRDFLTFQVAVHWW